MSSEATIPTPESRVRQTRKKLATAKSVASLKPESQRYVVYDSKVTGLELHVMPDGSKTWSLRYRVHGQQRRLKLGNHSPLFSLAQAREQAGREKRKVDDGVDPVAEKQAAIRAAEAAKHDSIEALCESYLEKHAKVKKRSWRADAGKLRNDVLPRWKGRPVTSITRRDCRALVEGIADRGAPVVANRVAALLSRLFHFAVDAEIVDTNPAWKLPKPGVEAGNRPEGDREPKPYDADEIRAIWQNTEHLDAAPKALIRIGLVTGQRPSEISDLEWRELDGQWWTIPGRRAKNGRDHRVYLTQTALDLLGKIPRVDDEIHVFRNYRGKRQLAALNVIAFADVRRRDRPRHALRDTTATQLAAAGVPVEHISRVLNHSVGLKVTQGYIAHAFDKEKRVALLKWDRRLRGIVEQTANEDKVVSIAAVRA